MISGHGNPPPPSISFLYEMVVSFFEAARQSLDPVLQAIGGYDEFAVLEDGRPKPPGLVMDNFSALPSGDRAHHLGACLTATTNLGLAYVHSFRLLSWLSQGKDALPPTAVKPNLTKLYDSLPKGLRDDLSGIYERVGSHDF